MIARDAGSSSPLSHETLTKFVDATAKGYEYAMRDAAEASAILAPHCQPPRSSLFLAQSQEKINKYYKEEGPASKLGYMRPEKWKTWLSWLETNGLLQRDLDLETAVFTNEFFE